MKTITLQIGNSDDKLSQLQWSDFFATIDREVTNAAKQVHFAGTSPCSSPWQNACWVFTVEPLAALELKIWVTAHRSRFRQDSVAWIEGETEFI